MQILLQNYPCNTYRDCQRNKSVTDELLKPKAGTPSDTNKRNALHCTENRTRVGN